MNRDSGAGFLLPEPRKSKRLSQSARKTSKPSRSKRIRSEIDSSSDSSRSEYEESDSTDDTSEEVVEILDDSETESENEQDKPSKSTRATPEAEVIDLVNEEEGQPINAITARPKKPRRKPTAEERAANIQKRFNSMDDNLKSHHPELKNVFEDLQAHVNIPEVMDQPPGINATLLPYQREGLAWMRKQELSEYKGGILADEMGLGKTLQTISLIVSTHKNQSGPNLVVAPTVAVMQWRNEIERFTGNMLKVLVYHGPKRTSDQKEIEGHDVVLTTYAILESNWRKQQSGFTRGGQKVKEQSALHKIHWGRIILDEAHNIKDRNSSTTVAVVNLSGEYRLCLSGTPLQNRVGELYSLLRFLQVAPFNQYFCTKCECKSNKWAFTRQKCHDCGHVAMQHVNFFNHSMLKHIQKLQNQTGIGVNKMRLLLNRIMLRRTKVERADELGLPPRIVKVRRDYFNAEEKDLYMSIFSDSKRTFSTYVNQGVVLNNYANIFSLITRMRQLADHPDLVLRNRVDPHESVIVCKLCDDEAEDPVKSKCHHTFCRLCVTEYVEGFTGALNDLECPVCHIGLTIDLEQPAIEVEDNKKPTSSNKSIINRIRMDDTWRSSTKIEALLEELFRLRSNRQTIKSIVFSQFTSMLDLVEWRLARAGFNSVKLQGNLSPTQRDSIIKHFMDTPSVEVFLVSLKAGGVALNLCEASQVFLLDPWWNPSVEWQSGDRVHRIGQHRPVTITRLVIEDSIESRIIELQEKKANMINATIGSDDSALNRLSQGDMEFLFQN